jgi:hypothetical protein
VRNLAAREKQGKADISTLQKSGYFYLALTAAGTAITHKKPRINRGWLIVIA